MVSHDNNCVISHARYLTTTRLALLLCLRQTLPTNIYEHGHTVMAQTSSGRKLSAAGAVQPHEADMSQLKASRKDLTG